MTAHNSGLPSSTSVLDDALGRAALRIRVKTLLRYGGRALCWSAVPCALSVGFSKLQWYATPSPVLLAGVMSLAVLAAIVAACARPLTRLDVAKLTERRTDLKERLSSALEFRAQGAQEGFYTEQLQDADRHAGAISLKSAFPIKVPWELPVGLVCAIVVFLTFYLPTLPRFWSPTKKQEMAEVKKHGIEIEKLAKDTEKAADQQKLDETKRAAAEAKKLGEEMHKGKLTKKESLVALAKLTKKMEETQQKLAQPPAKKSLDQAHKDFQKSLDKLSKDKEDEARKAEEMKKSTKGQLAKDIKKPDSKMEPKPRESEAMRQSKQALQQMADALANQDNQQMQQAMQKMAEQMQKGEMSKEEMKQMQQALQQLAQSLKDTNQQDAAQQMQQLAEMMQNGNNMDAKSLQQMAAMMNSIGSKMGKGQNLGQMMDAKALGDLAQMLKEGRLTMAMGKGKGMGMRGRGPGNGYYGMGGPSTPMKDPDKTSPILVAMGKNKQPAGKGKQGSAAEFAGYLARSSGAPKHLPNGKVAGTRSEFGNEMQMSMTGDPQAAKSNSPYYQVVQTSKKQAESTLNKENIPASLKKQVKDYFDSIKP